MLVAARKIQKFAAGLTEEHFNASELHQSAIFRELQVIGEAARLVSGEGKAAHPEVDWDKIAGMRNRLIHENGAGTPPALCWWRKAPVLLVNEAHLC